MHSSYREEAISIASYDASVLAAEVWPRLQEQL